MPLIQSKSKKAFSDNVSTEMDSGKPQKQALAIAYGVKRKPKRKKMADGGPVSAKTESRPMPDQTANDSTMASQNASKKPLANADWTGQPTTAQAQSNNGRTVKRIKHPSMVPSDVFSTRLRDQEDDLQSSAPTGTMGEQPPKADNEEDAAKSGPEIAALHMKRMAEGGMINKEVSMSAAEDDGVEHPSGLEEDDDQMRPSEDEYMANHFAQGGTPMTEDMASRPDKGWGAIIVRPNSGGAGGGTKGLMMADGGNIDEEDEIEHAASVAAAIMAKRKMMANGGSVDLSQNADEEPNNEDQMSFNALRKENYSESEGLSDLDYDTDMSMSPEHEPVDVHDGNMVDKIRRKMKTKSPISR